MERLPTALPRRLGLVSATATVVGHVVAVGIFLTPGAMAKSLGSPLWVLLVWIVMGGMALCGALCYGELAARYPEAGGPYVYLREAWGRRLAFLYGWKCLLVMDPGITAALATGLAAYLAIVVPLAPSAAKALAITCVLALAAANMLGLRLADAVVRTLSVAKLAALFGLVLWGFARGTGAWNHFIPFLQQRPGSAPLLPALAGAILAAFFSFGGWWEAAKIGGEVRDPARTLPRALVLGVTVVTVVYVLVSAVFIYLVPMEAVTSGETFAAQAGAALFGATGGRVLAGVVVLSVLGSLSTVTLLFPRLYYAMARDGLFLASMGELHPRSGAPARAIGLQAVVASILIAVGTFSAIVAYFVFVTVAFLGLTVAGLFVLRARQHPPGPSYRLPGYPVTPAIFLVLTALVLGLLAGGRPKESMIGLLVVALGIPVFEWVGKRRGTVAGQRGGQP